MPPISKISFDEFKKVEVTVGKILTAEKVPDTDKLLRLQVDFGNNTNLRTEDTKVRTEDLTTPDVPSLEQEGRQDTPLDPPSKEEGGQTLSARDIRQIISGIAAYFPDPQSLVGRKCMFVTNLEPRVIKGLESNGMLFAVSTEDGKFSLLEPSPEIPEGTKAK